MPSSQFLFNETIKYLKKQHGIYYLTEPHLLYLSQDQSKSFCEVLDNEAFTHTFHSHTVDIIEANAPKIFHGVNTEISVVELGPGYADKVLPIAKYFHRLGHPLHYYPVDVNAAFLNIAKKVMQPYVAQIEFIHSTFEECVIPKQAYDLPVYIALLGITFGNFETVSILALLKKLAGKSGKILIDCELLTKQNSIENILQHYQVPETIKFAFGPLANLGIKEDEAKCTIEFNNSRVEFKFLITADIAIKDLPLKKGDKIVTAISARYTYEELDTLLAKNFPHHEIYLSNDKGTAVAIGSM